jgi:hypothetical protein
MNPPLEIECMSRFGVTAVIAGVLAVVGVEAYGIYSTRHLLDTRLSQMESEIDSVRAANAALASQVVAPAAKREPDAAKPPVVAKANSAKAPAGTAHIVLDPKVAAKLQKLLPAKTNLNEASKGFKNETQFIEAVYVSKDLGIPFARLKARITGDHPISLETAVRDLRPDLSKAKAKAEVEKGQREAIATARLSKSASV